MVKGVKSFASSFNMPKINDSTFFMKRGKSKGKNYTFVYHKKMNCVSLLSLISTLCPTSSPFGPRLEFNYLD